MMPVHKWASAYKGARSIDHHRRGHCGWGEQRDPLESTIVGGITDHRAVIHDPARR
jgi:hypothetical protein